MDHNYLKGQDGDRINAVLAAAGFNFHLLLRWLAALLRATFLVALQSLVSPQPVRLFTSRGTSRTTPTRFGSKVLRNLRELPIGQPKLLPSHPRESHPLHKESQPLYGVRTLALD
jgi:hypothetical protein